MRASPEAVDLDASANPVKLFYREVGGPCNTFSMGESGVFAIPQVAIDSYPKSRTGLIAGLDLPVHIWGLGTVEVLQ